MTNSKFNAIYLEKIDNLISAFKDRFIDFQKMKMQLDLFSNTFAILPEKTPESAQVEIIDMQNDENLRNKFNENNLLNFYRFIDQNKYKWLLDNALKMASHFGSTFHLEY